jgi:hypothetical protein
MTDAYLDAGQLLGNSTEGTASYSVDMPNFTRARISNNGLITLGGEIFEEYQWELRWPYAIETFKKMAHDETIAPALNLVEMAIARVPWTVEIPEGYEEELKDKKQFLLEVMNDMTHTWGFFIRQAVTMNRYGFSTFEKVYRRRTKGSGSKFNDGKIGLKALPMITQDSIASWQWDEDGLEVTGMLQWKNKPAGLRQYIMLTAGQYIAIPRSKYLLFRNNPLKDDPAGTSPLVSVWRAWKYKQALQESEAMGIATDVRGLKVLYIPPRYLDPNASDADKETFLYYQEIMRNIHKNEQSGIILPQVLDERGEQYFKFEMLGIQGQKGFDISAVIARYEKSIITALMASQMILGQGAGGSYSLAESLSSISEMAIEAKLQEIQEQLNHDLVIQLFKLNNWDTTVVPQFKYGKVEKQDIDAISKYLQRAGSQGLISQDAKTVNWVHSQLGMPLPFDPDGTSVEEVRQNVTTFSSNSGAGMESGLPGGTGKADGSSGDSSTSNGENT